MKATLEFDLDDAGDKMAHMRCVKALDMAIVIWEMRFNLKNKLYNESESKFSFADNPEDSDDKVQLAFEAGIQLVLDQMNEMLDEYNLNPEELIV